MLFSIFDDMERCTPDEVQRLLTIASQQRREKALRFSHLFGQFACLKSYEMLVDLLNRWGIDTSRPIEFEYNEHGKPSLKGVPNVYFNISHCKNAIAVAIDMHPIGIDVEQLRLPSPPLLNRTMNDIETTAVKQSNSPEIAFTRIWTQKEAVFKMQGTGIRDNIKNVLDGIERTTELHTIDCFEKNYVCTIAIHKTEITY